MPTISLALGYENKHQRHPVYGLSQLLNGPYSRYERFAEESSSRAELIITKTPFPLIPSKAVSCYSQKITPPGQMPVANVENDYFRIPQMSFFRSETKNDMIISNIRITYAIPSREGLPEGAGKCEIAGDELRALSSFWWRNGVEAIIPGSSGEGGEIFTTDCALYCGGIANTRTSFRTTADVEVFGLERDSKTGNETPVKLSRKITIEF